MAITAKILYIYGYNRNALSSVNFIQIYNSGTSDEYFNAIKVRMGIPGKGVTFNDPMLINGRGLACTIKLTCSSKTSTQTIKKEVKSISNAYPDYDDCQEYTFTFSDYIKIPAEGNVIIKITKESSESTLVFDHFAYGDNSTTATSKTYPKENISILEDYVYIYDGTSWKKAIPYVCTAVASDGTGTWKQAIPYVCTAVTSDGTGTWKKCGN